ncbi:MAG: Stk1 family PASTA domain-containing Ser/Thr kinase [Raoultibacter sp.]
MTGNMIGKVFNNRYQITERIGIGGMAEVFRAQDNVLGRLVAVKTMLPQYAADPNFTQRFKHEAAAAANLQSPYIVNVYDWGHDDDTYYIVMEYVRGSDLKTAINERGAINQRKVAEIGSQVCQALSVAHNLDIIHRDIKPQNIMVQPDGNVKVMDFGIARAKNSVKTQTSSVLGTAHYISPEQAQGKDLTATSDIYSLGIVLYEAATGRLPFDGPDAVSVAMKQVNDLPVPPREINPDIDPAFEAIIMRAMAKSPYERFNTANDMKLALNDYLAGRPVNVNGFGGAETAVLGGAVGMGAGAVMADGTAVMPAMSNGGVKPVNTQSTYRANGANNNKGNNTKKTVAIVIGVLVALALIGGAVFALTGGFASGDPIPDVKGQTVEQATQALEKAGFKVGKTTEVTDDTVEAGKVLSTDPPAGSKREKDTTVNLNVSKGPGEVKVPDLRGKSSEDAKKLLAEAGLKGEQGTAEYNSDVAVNHVISQTPEPGASVTKNTVITYILSLGTENAEIPDVRNYSQSEAITTLENAGFKAKVVDGGYNDVEAGYVISQNPTGKADKGSTVTITVSKGPKPTNYYSITASVTGSGGSISPSGSVELKEGDSQSYSISPYDGYEIKSVTVDGVEQGPITSYSFSNVTGNHTITVVFAQKATPTPGTNGS